MSLMFPPLPTLTVDPTLDWAWPLPHLACEPLAATIDGAEPCRIESITGVSVSGELLGFDAGARQMRFRVKRGVDAVNLSFAKCRRVTLTRPLVPARRAPDAPIEHLPPQAQRRTVAVTYHGGGHAIGTTQGSVEHGAGWFLFAPDEDGLALLRQFVPRSAVASIDFGVSAEERVAERWVHSPAQLLAAVEAQRDAPVLPLGEALADLGLVAPEIIEAALREQEPPSEAPLGERLVARGLIDRADLTTALAHKMGYPLVDLGRFPIDAQAVKLMSPRAMREHRALPLMLHGRRLIVAVDDLGSIASLKSLRALAGMELVPVLAPPGRLSFALAARASEGDVWAHNVPAHVASLG